MKGICAWSLALGLAAISAVPAYSDETVFRYRDILELTGTVEARIVSLDPTNPAPDVPKEKRYFLHLEQALSVTRPPNGDKDLYPDEKGVVELQLMSNAPPERSIEPALQAAAGNGARVILTGALFHASTKQHYTKVLMEVAGVKAAPPPVVDGAAPAQVRNGVPPPPPVPLPALSIAAPIATQ